jgi:N-dimethylarginine dimethylaminohydrolase
MAWFGAHHEWGKLGEVVVGIAPADDLVVFHEESQRWLGPAAETFSRKYAGRRLIDVDRERAICIERRVEVLAGLLAREGVVVHRPQRLSGEERRFLAANGEGNQLFVRDAMIVVADHVVDASLRLRCRQRERFGLRPIVQRAGPRWSSAPLGSPAGVDGPFLEGGDVLLNGNEIYVGLSGCASDLAGADWLQTLLGESYRVIPVAMRSNVLHLDWVLGLIKPGLLLYCPEKLIDGLPMSLRDWDKIAVSADEATRLAVNVLVLEPGRVIADAANGRVIDELRRRKIDVIALPFDGPVALGGGLRSAHHPLVRESSTG